MLSLQICGWFIIILEVNNLNNFFWLNFVIMMYNLIKQCNRGWKMTPFADKLVSIKLCFYQDIFFATGSRILWKNEKPVTLGHSL